MYEGNLAQIKMVKMLLSDDKMDHRIFECDIIVCKESTITILLKDAELVDISLDAIYECSILEGDTCVTCKGRMKERYENQQGKVLVFEITNGFYQQVASVH